MALGAIHPPGWRGFEPLRVQFFFFRKLCEEIFFLLFQKKTRLEQKFLNLIIIYWDCFWLSQTDGVKTKILICPSLNPETKYRST